MSFPTLSDIISEPFYLWSNIIFALGYLIGALLGIYPYKDSYKRAIIGILLIACGTFLGRYFGPNLELWPSFITGCIVFIGIAALSSRNN